MLKVGTRVKINKNLTIGYWSGVFAVEDMLKFKGKKAVIKEIENEKGFSTTYKLDIDDEYWHWSSGMFTIINNKIIELE